MLCIQNRILEDDEGQRTLNRNGSVVVTGHYMIVYVLCVLPGRCFWVTLKRLCDSRRLKAKSVAQEMAVIPTTVT